MQQYPNYSQMNNPYAQMNNMYAQPNNPYADRMNFLQNYQQSLQQPVVPAQTPVSNQMTALGKMVDSIDVVKATDIPMDGNTYYFPKADGTEVYCKQWLQNGTTRILTFKPVFEDDTNNLSYGTEKLKIGLSDDVTEVFMKRFDELEKRFDDLIPKPTTKTTATRTKKETGV